MPSTIPQYQRDLDRTRPLSGQWGGRLLTEAEAVKLRPPMNEIEYVGMNLEHLRHELYECDEAPVMTAEHLGVLIDLADELEWASRTYLETAARIRAITPDLWVHRIDPEASVDA